MSEKFDALHTPEAESLLKDTGRLKALLRSPETLRLMKLLSQRNGDALRQAAQQAKGGNTSAVQAMMKELTNTSEGAELVEKLQKRYNQGK